MADYGKITKEETFKARIVQDFFSSSRYAYEPNIGNIDFIITEKKTQKDNLWTRHYLWAESKKGIADIYTMLTHEFNKNLHEIKGSGNRDQGYCTKVQSAGNQFRFRTTISDPRSPVPNPYFCGGMW